MLLLLLLSLLNIYCVLDIPTIFSQSFLWDKTLLLSSYFIIKKLRGRKDVYVWVFISYVSGNMIGIFYILFNFSLKTFRSILIAKHRWGIWDSEKLNNLLQFTELVCGRVGLRVTRFALFLSVCCFHLNMMPVRRSKCHHHPHWGLLFYSLEVFVSALHKYTQISRHLTLKVLARWRCENPRVETPCYYSLATRGPQSLEVPKEGLVELWCWDQETGRPRGTQDSGLIPKTCK